MSRPSLLVLLLPLFARVATAVEPPRMLENYALFALDDFRTKGLTLSNGALGVNDGRVYAHGPIKGDGCPVAADVVRIDPDSQCSSLHANLVDRSGPACDPGTPFTGPIIADPRAACGMPAAPAPCDAARPLMIRDDATVDLPPGAYGDVFIDGGPRAGTLRLQGGDYSFCSLRVSRNGVVTALAPTTVNITGTFMIGPQTLVAPDATAALAPTALRLFTDGPSVRISRAADVHALLCAPEAQLRITEITRLEGTFLAKTIRTERITVRGVGFVPESTTTTTASATTSTTAPPASTTSTTTLPGVTTTTVSSSTTTTAVGPTTTTTDPCLSAAHCGDGVLNCGEVCDPMLPTPCDAGSPMGAMVACVDDCQTIDHTSCPPSTTTTTLTGATTTSISSTTTTSTTTLHGTTTTTLCTSLSCPNTVGEICGNCIDDDGDGQIDFEDTDCCGATPVFGMAVRKGKMMPRRDGTCRFVLRAAAGTVPAFNPDPLHQDVFVQLRSASTGELLCAQIPAMKFMKRGKRKVGFWDYKRHVVSARGLDDVAFRFRPSGEVKLRVLGRRAQFAAPDTDTFQITLGLRDPANAARNLCSSTQQPFVAHHGKNGRLLGLW